MHKYFPTRSDTSRTQPGRSLKCFARLRLCGLFLATLWAISGCSAVQTQNAEAPLNETTPCDICTEGEAADSGTLPVSESDAPGQAPDQEQQQGEYLQANDDPNSTPEPDPSVDKTDNSTPGTTPGIDIPNPDTTQTSAPDREQASTTPLIVENASTPTAQPPETVKQYTVTIGENLYTIASRPIVYADGMLWPLIYRANRDQIKDPRQIYPGQVLNIPRDISKQDRDQARVRAEENPIFTSGGLPSQRE